MLYLAVIFPFIVHFLPIKNKKIKLAISIAPAIYIILFRWGLGTDYFSYELLYNNHNTTSFAAAMTSQSFDLEKGFMLLFFVFKSLNLSFHTFAALISLVIYLFFIKWLSDTEQNTPLLVMLFNGMFFVVWTLSAFRQGLVLSIGTYLFFNKKDKLNTFQSIIVIIILAQFHSAAYFYLILIIIKKLNFNRKSLLIILCLSLLSTLLPLQYLLRPFEDFSLVNRILLYTTDVIGFWDFAGIIRLIFSGIVLIFYSTFKENKYMKILADMSIIGFSSYYFLKFSEITASRLSIFTFILIIPLSIYILDNVYYVKKFNKIFISTLLIFSITYMQKDILAYQNQVGRKNIDLFYRFERKSEIELNDYLNYDNLFAFLTYQKKYCKQEPRLTSPLNKPLKNDGYMLLKEGATGLYGVLNDIATWQIEPTFETEPDLLKDIVIYNYNEEIFYYNINYERIDVNESIIDDLKEEAIKINEYHPDEFMVDYSAYKRDLIKILPYDSNVTESVILKYKIPFEYNTLRITYRNKKYYFMLDDQLAIKNDFLITDEIKFDINNIAKATSMCGFVVFNSNGDIIYQEIYND